jgi:diguanylate cyclase (GGDEF)-like protein/PAS domain S-box-containing protein
MSADEMGRFLLDLVHRMADALYAEPFSPAPAVAVGEALVDAEFIGEGSLQVSVEILGSALLDSCGDLTSQDLAGRVVALLSGVATGYTGRSRLRTLDQQEHMKQALLKSKREAEAREREAEAKFEEVFYSSAIGMALTDLDGTCVQTNPALGRILEYQPDELQGRSIFELFDPAHVADVRNSYQEVAEGLLPRTRHRRRMLRADDTVALVYCVVSVLIDANGAPSHYVTMVEDLSELQELQNQLGHQSVHDVLTGLYNRQHFEARVAAAMESATDESLMTLIYLGIDALSVINHGLGHDAGDQVLKVVAAKLNLVAATEDATVSRVAGDEFAILMTTAHSPPVQQLIDEINFELSEPVYIGDTGVAVCASIGIYRHTGRFPEGAAPLRAANSAMRKAKADGKRQWAIYDEMVDKSRKGWFARAAAMPGAWENGELDIEYEPVIRLTDNGIAGLQLRLRWEHGDQFVVNNEQWDSMADHTGMSLTIGPWAFERAAEQVRDHLPLLDDGNSGWPAMLRLRLTPLQSTDGDLVQVLNRVIQQSGLPPKRIEVAVDTRAMLAGGGVAQDNLEALADIGVVVALHEFSGGYREFALVEEFDVRSVILMGDPNESCLPEPNPGSLLTKITVDMVASLHERGSLVSVVDVPTKQAARWWRTIGADLAQGAFAGRPGQPQRLIPGIPA